MFRFNLGLCVAVNAILLGAALPTQAAVSFLEDFEGPPAPPGTIDAIGWSPGGGGVGYGPGAMLGTNVALMPASNRNLSKPFSGSLEDKIVFSVDYGITGVYDTAGGEGLAGITGPVLFTDSLLAGPMANPANPGYPGPGGGGWALFDGIGGTNRVNITDGGSPGVGNQFKGIGSGTVRLEMAIDQIADTISIDIYDLVGGASINPTWVMPLTATAEANLANVNSVMLAWNDVFGDTKEIDNLRVNSIPEPSSILLLAMGLIAVALRRRRLS